IIRSSDGQSILGTRKLLTQVTSFDDEVAASVVVGTGPQPQDFSHVPMIRFTYQVSFWSLKTI
ncbi:hypothetical protein N4Q66_26860, partial [Leclercia adecarboxylata]|uniref:hypothetical protein n=1 Tax=Leclercia adecarboxylata TaxID=83655 RepID=UPI00234C83B9